MVPSSSILYVTDLGRSGGRNNPVFDPPPTSGDGMTTHHQAEIRLLRPDDAVRYREIRLEGLKQNAEAFSSAFERENTMPLSWFEERIVKGNILGAFAGGELQGVAGSWPQEGAKVSHKAVLWGMYVRKPARRSGLAQRLVEAVIAHASGHVEQLLLSIASDNEPAHRLYKKAGFSEYGREIKALKQDGRYFDEILMVRFLVRD
jgi:RimJ/RimL family protein N-acetyltransferase